MKTSKTIILGAVITALSLFFVSVLQTPVTQAATATSEAQLQNLAKSLQKQDNGNITGTLANQTITFKRETGSTQGGIPTNSNTYTADNLSCGGKKATITTNPGLSDQSTMILNASYQQGSNCTETTISVSFDSTGAAIEDPGNGPGDNISCESTDSGPLGWILCPIIDGAGQFTQFVFDSFVQPFLEDVPVTTNPEDGSYVAWNSFRIIGNIILVGTMLAVVYAQIRGDR